MAGGGWSVEDKPKAGCNTEFFSLGARRSPLEIPEHKEDLYRHKAKYLSALRRLEDWKTSENNKDLIKKFHVHMCAEGLSLARKVKYLHILMKISTIVNRDIVLLDDKDLQDFKIWLNYSPLQLSTREDYILALKKVFEFLGRDVSKLKIRRSRKKKLPEELITPEEAKAIINCASNIRDKALLSLLYETGARIGEIMNLKTSDVIFDEIGCYVRLDGKTGQRRNRIVQSINLLEEWIRNSPSTDSKRWLWIRRDGQRLGYPMVRKILKTIAKKLNLKKRIYPHLFRHSRSTELAKHLTEQQLKAYLGWTADSRMASTYVHLSGKDVDDAILRLNGSGVVKRKNLSSGLEEFMEFYRMWKLKR